MALALAGRPDQCRGFTGPARSLHDHLALRCRGGGPGPASGVFRYLGGRFPRKNKNKVAAGGVFRYLGGRFPRKNKNKVAAGKWGG
ncbi:hypothetical protein NDU88_003678 [Pleurodeles waltl]|uniref:Uncharacterized protein n=1 Tax=Pleurodeles waltl TaxID=8319 RepID=A0AAV7QAQ5_PLEWA|nr:hypothetical protein NDU88_003678 [Pleurodeles waltl]